jgi:DNA polymerase III alpha subunit (gram-positive type)
VDTGKVVDELELLIKPTIAKKLPQETIDITGIDDAMLKDKHQFYWHSDAIRKMIEEAPICAAHNAAYDKEVLTLEFDRAQKHVEWPRIICTVEQTMHFKGHRLSLTALHELLFGEGFPEAHRARTDVSAMVRCIVELVKRGELL